MLMLEVKTNDVVQLMVEMSLMVWKWNDDFVVTMLTKRMMYHY